ncbi:MAG: hypothetical protein M1818_007318 [Claussenomyces sp. TS43310]|nr:MAG: hypothetical protein M1818_007318 [Claussenomyces sp. TS43310]
MSALEPPLPPAAAQEFVGRFPDDSRFEAHRRSASSTRPPKGNQGFRASIGLGGMARRTLGILLLLATVFLWTASNFLASYIFADDSYSKPYFVTYVNTSLFAISLLPILLRIAHQHGYHHIKASARAIWQGKSEGYGAGSGHQRYDDVGGGLDQSISSETGLLNDDGTVDSIREEAFTIADPALQDVLSVRETIVLSLEFCLLWFVANYFVAACLKYTSVASSTIITSTSSIWTLIFGAMFRVERFSFKKLTGVLASLAGIVLISMIDLSSDDNDGNRGSFPHKDRSELAIGNAMALFSAVMYGLYTIIMKKRIGNEDRVNMPLFFGLVGLFNVIFLWPGFLVLHFTGVETFELPPTGKIWAIVLVRASVLPYKRQARVPSNRSAELI